MQQLSVLGQESWRANVVIRNQAPFDDMFAFRRVLTIRGRTGAVLGMFDMATGKAEEIAMALGNNLPSQRLRQVVSVLADNATGKLYTALRRIMPNLLAHKLVLLRPKLKALQLTRYATWRKKTSCALFLRKVLRKFLATSSARTSRSWSPFYHGFEKRDLQLLESRRRDLTLNASLLKCTAKKMVDNLDDAKPFGCTLDFIEATAVLAAMFLEDICRKVTGANNKPCPMVRLRP